MDWERLKLFYQVAEAGSFTRAGQQLNLNQSSISRQIKALEDSLNLSLFNRHARGLVLTGEGEQLFAVAAEMARRIEATEASLLESKERPRGRLKLTTTVSFGTSWLAPQLADFVAAYPEVDLELLLDDEPLNLARREADVAIRIQRPQQQDLIQLLLLSIHLHLYAAPAYLERRGRPQTIADLDAHDIITYGPRAPLAIRDLNWPLSAGVTGPPRRPVFSVNNVHAVMRAVESGMGLAVLPDYVAALSPGLQRLLDDMPGPEPADVYFVYPSELRKSKRVAVLKDYLVQRARQMPADF